MESSVEVRLASGGACWLTFCSMICVLNIVSTCRNEKKKNMSLTIKVLKKTLREKGLMSE